MIKNISYIIDETRDTLTPEVINGRLLKIMNKAELKGKNRDAYWNVSFEEGVDQSQINEEALQENDDDSNDLSLKLDRTHWRYDFGFTTPSGIFFI